MNQEAFVVDNSIQISNFDFTPRDFEITIDAINSLNSLYYK